MASSSSSSSSISQATKIEDSPEPLYIHSPTDASAPPTIPSSTPSVMLDSQDPDGFLRRCSGHNKKTRVRCSATIGKNAKNAHPTFLPTCHAHRDQQSFAGWCQFMQKDGERCGRLFRWTPPYFELCEGHQGHPDTPCHFMELPLELRQEIFRYLLPTQPIGSSSSPLHQESPPTPPQTLINSPTSRRAGGRSMFQASPPADNRLFPFPIVDLFLVSQRVYDEVKDLLYSSVPFTIDIRKDGTFMCGRRLLEPRRPDGSAHFTIDDAEKVARKFTNTFDFTAVKNYNVDILVENCADDGRVGYHPNQSWDEEVEMYDIRDYCGVVVSGILSKARNLCKLNVRLGLSKFNWKQEELLANVKCLVGPFERLRNVRQPRLRGVFDGFTQTNFMVNVPVNSRSGAPVDSNQPAPLCSVPRLPTHTSLIFAEDPKFDAYKQGWEKLVSKISDDSLPAKPPIRGMFTEFKQFYTKLSAIVPAVMHRHGKHAFLHRARVARENENVEAFRHLRNELIHYWYLYVEQEEQRKRDMEAHMSRMLDSDVYPSNEMESVSPREFSSTDSNRMTVDKNSNKSDRRSDQRERSIRDTKPEHLGHSQFTDAAPSGTASPQQLQHNQSMALNPPSESVDIARARDYQPYVQSQARARARARDQAQVQAQAAAQEETASQARQSVFRHSISHPQAIMMPNMPDQQQMEPTATASNELTPKSSSEVFVEPLKKSSPSLFYATSSATQNPDLSFAPFNPPEGWNDTWSKTWQDTQSAPYAQMEFQQQQPQSQSQSLEQEQEQQQKQRQQQILLLQLMRQQRSQQAQQAQQYPAQVLQRYQYEQSPQRATTTAHIIPEEPHRTFKEVTQDCMQPQSDRSATVSPMTAHSAIPSCGSGFFNQNNDDLVNGPSGDGPYAHMKAVNYDDNHSYQMSDLNNPPSSKRRRIDSGISVGDETQNGHVSPMKRDVIMTYSVNHGGVTSYNYSAQSSVPYVGKGKGRAIEVEEPREVVWLD